MLFSGAWGKVIHEKTWSKKSRDTVPLTCHYYAVYSLVWYDNGPEHLKAVNGSVEFSSEFHSLQMVGDCLQTGKQL